MTKQVHLPNVHELLQLAQAGDVDARDKLFAWCSEAVNAWATRALVKNPHGHARPSDIAQEASMRAFRKFSSFRGTTEGEWMAWLKAIVERCSKQSLRDTRRMKRDPNQEVWLDAPENENVPAPQPSPSQATADEEQWHQLLSAIYELGDDQRQAIWLFHLKKLRVKEVAERLGKNETQIAGLLQRGVETLRQRLSPESAPIPGLATPSLREATTAALLDYLRRREAGETVDVEAFIAEHPSCRDELRTQLSWMMRIEAIDLKKPDEGDE
jgi:RNA polymerase sigma-70 factor (ECF subfamily)